ncbi:MAG: hypothetical protein EOO10_04335 [Chitinophagaceae bacterium]|nr:MAG: hypothetical protein EOO10_04335 [Chitinophagaceae bacterium]
MKKSNKLLLGGFLALLLLISAIHISLFAKYKAGDYTVYNSEEELTSQSIQSFPNILFVAVRNVPGANITFGDAAHVEKTEESDIQYVQKGDTLLITVKDSSDPSGFKDPVSFQVPYNATITAFNSTIDLKTGRRAAGNNPVIYLQKSTAYFSGTNGPLQLGHVKLFASDGSRAAFEDKAQVNNLEVQLSNSSLEYGDGDFGQLSIVTDSLSRLSLSSKHLLKANIKTVASQ